MIPASKQAGAALLSILLIVATLSVAALMAVDSIARQTELQKLGSRKALATWAARSAEALALSSANELIAASRIPAGNVDTERAQTVVLPINGGNIRLTLKELPPCLNLNALDNIDDGGPAKAADAITILLEDLGISAQETAHLRAVLADWIDADSVEQPGGAEDGAYLSAGLGFRAGNQALRSLQELAPLPGFTPELRVALSTGTCVLPLEKQPAINVNALSFETAHVLRAAAGGTVSLAQARRFIDARPASGWKDVQQVSDFASRSGTLDPVFSQVPIAVQGTYFTGEGVVTLDTGDWRFRFLLDVGADGAPTIVWRSFGSAS